MEIPEPPKMAVKHGDVTAVINLTAAFSIRYERLKLTEVYGIS